MSDYKKAVLRTISGFVLFSAALSVVGSLAGASPGDPNALGVIQLIVGFASLGVFIWMLFRIDKRFPQERR